MVKIILVFPEDLMKPLSVIISVSQIILFPSISNIVNIILKSPQIHKLDVFSCHCDHLWCLVLIVRSRKSRSYYSPDPRILSHKNFDSLINEATSGMATFSEWFQINKLSLNVKKIQLHCIR